MPEQTPYQQTIQAVHDALVGAFTRVVAWFDTHTYLYTSCKQYIQRHCEQMERNTKEYEEILLQQKA